MPERGDDNAQEICDQLAEFVRAFPALSEGERKLVVDSLIREVALKHQEVAVVLTPPLSGLGFVSTELAPRGIEERVSQAFVVKLSFGLDFIDKGQYASSDLPVHPRRTGQQQGNRCSFLALNCPDRYGLEAIPSPKPFSLG